VKSYLLLVLLGLVTFNTYAGSTHIQHIIKNKTPFEFYYTVIPATEVPAAFSCNCVGVIGPGEQHICDCFSQLENAERRYRLEYMKNISPTFRLSSTYAAGSEVAITWELVFDSYWEWLGVKSSDKPLG